MRQLEPKEQCQRYLESGMDRVLRKPFSAREFSELLKHYMLASPARGACT